MEGRRVLAKTSPNRGSIFESDQLFFVVTFEVKGNEMMSVAGFCKILSPKRISEIGFVVHELSPTYQDLVRSLLTPRS
jgi:hypothetical protein